MSKGSTQRPRLIEAEEFADRWSITFGEAAKAIGFEPSEADPHIADLLVQLGEPQAHDDR